MTKAIAYYLPQFHEIPENNEWWGKGFTEWTNLKKATPLFDGHVVNKPLNDNYYDLLEKRTVEWQTELMKKYSMYGLVYYHYWFKGKKILEKPAENLLGWKDIDQKFMFMWANHDWTRSWVGGKEVLLKMEYGAESDWERHIQYLLPFFNDPRYIKIGNRPVFVIYNTRLIENLEQMMVIWNAECRKAGLGDVFLVDNIDYDLISRKKYIPMADAMTIQEHSAAVQYMEKKGFVRHALSAMKSFASRTIRKHFNITGTMNVFSIKRYLYDKVVKASLELMTKLDKKKKTFFGVCTGWDNTPRYGKHGYLVEGATPEKFKDYISKAKEMAEREKQEFIFIACWNEWCEGMVLEPTQKDGYGYLEAVRAVFGDSI